MVTIRRFPILRHLRAEPNRHVLHWSAGRLKHSGRGLSFWFRPLSASLADVPCDDRELPFLFHGRSRDFQDLTVQGVMTWRVYDPERVAERVDFSVDAATGRWHERPLDQLSDVLTSRAQELAWDYLAGHSVREVLADGLEIVRERIRAGLESQAALEEMGVEVVTIRVAQIAPTADLEQALQTPAMEAIQQQADEATFERRALAVEKERAIQENELQSQIELAGREVDLIAQRGANERRRASEQAAAAHISAEAAAKREELESAASANSIELVEAARVDAERQRIDIYKGLERHVLLGLAAREFASKLEKIEHLNVTPDLLGPLFGDLLQAGTRALGGGGRSEGA